MEIDKYIKGYKENYERVLEELERGYKIGHWMWFIFPQLKGLGKSNFSDYYGLNGIGDAKEFYRNRFLRRRMSRLFRTVNSFGSSFHLRQFFGETDSKKFHSCATIFYIATGDRSFKKPIEKFFNGELDENTMSILMSKGELGNGVHTL